MISVRLIRMVMVGWFCSSTPADGTEYEWVEFVYDLILEVHWDSYPCSEWPWSEFIFLRCYLPENICLTVIIIMSIKLDTFRRVAQEKRLRRSLVLIVLVIYPVRCRPCPLWCNAKEIPSASIILHFPTVSASSSSWEEVIYIYIWYF